MFEKELITALGQQLRAWSWRTDPKISVADFLCRVGAARRLKDPADPHRVLAALPFPIYLTTNPDRLLVEALREAGSSPNRLCPWNEWVDRSDFIFTRDAQLSPRRSPVPSSITSSAGSKTANRLSSPRTITLTTLSD